MLRCDVMWFWFGRDAKSRFDPPCPPDLWKQYVDYEGWDRVPEPMWSDPPRKHSTNTVILSLEELLTMSPGSQTLQGQSPSLSSDMDSLLSSESDTGSMNMFDMIPGEQGFDSALRDILGEHPIPTNPYYNQPVQPIRSRSSLTDSTNFLEDRR